LGRQISLKLIGEYWTSEIENASFKLTLPKEAHGFELYSGETGSTTNEKNCRWDADSQSISGTCQLGSESGITVRTGIDFFYFLPDLNEIIVFTIPAVLLATFMTLIFGFSKRFACTEDVKEINNRPLELNELVWGKQNLKAEILYLAGRGEVDLQQVEGGFEIKNVRHATGSPIDDKLTQALIEGGPMISH
jgi:hypothetical protein